MFCPNCGKEIEDDANFCRYCGKEVKQKNISQKQTQPQTREEIAKELNSYRICPKCTKKTSNNNTVCEHCGFDTDKMPDGNASCFASLVFIIFIFIVFAIFGGCNDKSSNTVSNNKSVEPVVNQERMDITNKFMIEAKNGGLVTNINKECTQDGEFCSYYIFVKENMWNMFSYQDKENFNTFVQEYAALRSKEAAAIVKGHYSGRVLADKFKGVRTQ